MSPDSKGVLVLYTGGTVGSVRPNPDNPHDPLVPGTAEQLLERLPLDGAGRMLFGEVAVPLTVIALGELFDSTNVKPRHWQSIARIIESRYDGHVGFVVLHGTDTMAYTASALSFMLANLDRPVVLTGAQRPIGEIRSDAVQNVITAVEIAAASLLDSPVIPGVSVFFHDELLRGCRVSKRSATAYAGFHSPNFPPLATVGDEIVVLDGIVRPPRNGPLKLHERLDPGVALLELTPLLDLGLLERLLAADELRAVVLKTYGAGNAPSDPAFLDVVGRAVERGLAIVAVTQCAQGSVDLGRYEVSAGLLERGVIHGLDLTPEAAQTKLAVLLGDGDVDIAAAMQVNLRGEQSRNAFDLYFPDGEVRDRVVLPRRGAFPLEEAYRPDRLRRAKLLVAGLCPESEGEAFLHLRVGFACGDETRVVDCPRLRWHPDDPRCRRLFLDVTELAEGRSPADFGQLVLERVEGPAVRLSHVRLSLFTEV